MLTPSGRRVDGTGAVRAPVLSAEEARRASRAATDRRARPVPGHRGNGADPRPPAAGPGGTLLVLVVGVSLADREETLSSLLSVVR